MRIGPYRVLQKLGAGGMGEVVLAHDDRLDRLVAIKRMHDDAATPERRERFRREARIVARLDHPAIVHIHDVLYLDGSDYLIMEYVAGQTLRARRDAGPMTVSEVLAIAHQIALGMAAAHDRGVIHRDLKAENVLITQADRAKVTDFGIAKIEGDDTVTADGAVIGTCRAMSPEQALGRPIDHRSDLFSFGILLYEALTGQSPFRADTSFLTVQRLVRDEPPPLHQLVPSIPDGLARLVGQLLAKEPMLRPRDFHEVADALSELAGEAGDAKRHAGSSLGGLPPAGDDPRPTEHSIAPPQPVLDSTAPRDHARGASARTRPHRRWWRAAALGAAVLATLGFAYAARGGCSSDDWDWRAVDIGKGAGRTLLAMWGSKPDDIYLVGTDTMFHHDGAAWKMMDPPRISPRSTAYLHDIWGSGPTDIFVVGEDYVGDLQNYTFTSVIWHYDGVQWQLVRSGPSRATRMGSAFFRVWGSSAHDVFVLMNVSNQFSLVLHYDGIAWSPMVTGSEPKLTAIWGRHRADVFAVGYGGTIRHYDGTKWEPMDAEVLGDLFAVWGTSSNDVYAVGYPGVVLHYDGTRWRSAGATMGTSTVWSVWGSGSHDVFIAGESVMHYDGASWRPVKLPLQSQYWHAWGTDPQNIYVFGSDSLLKHHGERALPH